MKKLFSLLLVFAFLLSLVACADNGRDGSPADTSEKEPEATTEPETTEAPVGEYVIRHKYAEIDEVLDRPEIETDISRLRDFYTVTKDTTSFHGRESLLEIAISVKGYGTDMTELVFKQQSTAEIWEDNTMTTSASAIIILDNKNKTFKVCEAQSTSGFFDEAFESAEAEAGEDDIVGGILGLFGSVFNGEYRDVSDKYTYETAKESLDGLLGMYTGIGFFDFMKNNYPDVKFTKRPDEGNCFVYKTEIDGTELRFKLDRETGLFGHASYTGREHFEVTEYSFTECLHTDADIPEIAK